MAPWTRSRLASVRAARIASLGSLWLCAACSGADAEGGSSDAVLSAAAGSDGSTEESAGAGGSGADPSEAATVAGNGGTPADGEGGDTENLPDPTNAIGDDPGGDASASDEPTSSEDPVDIPPGDGFFSGGQCFVRCESDATDADEQGVVDGFGFELGASCIVEGSAPALAALPCIPEAPPEPEFPPGSGFFRGDTCFPACLSAAGVDAQGFGFEQLRSCILPDSEASLGTLPCEPPPAEVIGQCPADLICPSVDGQALQCGCDFVLGFAERKQAIAAAGGDRRFLASAMMETNTLTTDYPFGDVNPDGSLKTGDAFNAGLANQNWGMIRQCHPDYQGLGAGQFAQAAEMNDNLAHDIDVYDACRATFGANWFGGHRNGSAGLNDGNTFDIRRFQAATQWTFDQLEEHLDDDVYFFVVVEAI